MASSLPSLSLTDCFADLPDPRVERTRLHALSDILVIAICAVLCGAEGGDDIAEFSEAKRDWLQERLTLEHGLPCADTYRRVQTPIAVCSLLGSFAAGFLRWVQALQEQTKSQVKEQTKSQVIAVDGKTLRHSFDAASAQQSIHMVSAWALSSRLVLAQAKVEAKSNEITAVPALLSLLDLTGCIVTADAMICQRAIAAQIVQQGGDYVLALKGNQESLHDDVRRFFEYAATRWFEATLHQEYFCRDNDHGRIETRRLVQVDLAHLESRWADVQQQWAGLSSLLMLQSERQIGQKTTTETRYYLCSLSGDAKKAAHAVRQHWGIENSVHWVLDVVFDEDACRIRKDHGPQNFVVLRHMAMNLLRQEKTNKRGIKAKQKRAGWDNAFLTKLLTN